jgi:hypothetical protein
VRPTARDARLARDLALSRLLSRDQILALGYFGSVTRLNARMRGLRASGMVSVLETPFFGQHLYVAGRNAAPVCGEPVASLILEKDPSPRFVRHAMAVTDLRVALLAAGARGWRFESQLWRRFPHAGRGLEIRPDGMVFRDGVLTLLEADMGHVDPAKFSAKLRAYAAFGVSGELARTWGEERMTVLTVTTGKLRRERLRRLAPASAAASFEFATFREMGVVPVGDFS